VDPTTGAPPEPPGSPGGDPPRGRPTRRVVLRNVGSLVLGVAILVVVLPRVTGARWSQVADTLGRLHPAQLALLTAIWLAGLWCYSFVLTATVPGLTRAQAVVVNVMGSAVSNLLPFGGAVGLAATFGVLRTWGVPPTTVALSALVTGVWNVLAKLALPLVGLVGLLLVGDVATRRLAAGAGVAAALLAVSLALFVGSLASERVAAGVGRAGQAVGHGVLAVFRSDRRLHWADSVPRRRGAVVAMVRAGWWRMTLGLTGFLGSQAILLQLSLHLLGSTLNPAQVFAAFAFGRLLSTLLFTPGGVGIAETGVAGLLVAFGGDPAVCTSAVLLSSGFTFLAEFPAGGVGYLVWLTRRSWRSDVPADPADRPTA
jgi:uncharacterized membrane protein YbhN (UPF0104 family)